MRNEDYTQDRNKQQILDIITYLPVPIELGLIPGMVVPISEFHVHLGSVCITTESFYHWRQGQKINQGGIGSKTGPFVSWYQENPLFRRSDCSIHYAILN